MNSLEELSKRLQVEPDDLRQLVVQAAVPLSQQEYFHYVVDRPKGDGQTGAAKGPRSVMLFRSADEALNFARMVKLRETPKVQAISVKLALLRMLADERIGALIFLEHDVTLLPSGLQMATLHTIPGAYRITRQYLLDELPV